MTSIAQKSPKKKSIVETHPDLVEQWSPLNDREPSSVTSGSSYKAQWVCQSGHEWIARIHSRTAGRGCQECFLIRKTTAVPGVNDLATTHPDIAAEWSPENTRDVATVTYGSVHKAKWICSVDPGHTWEASANSRTNNNTWCPKCGNRKTSRVENQLQADLEPFVPVSTQGTGLRWSNGVPLTVDILAGSIAIEYDGSYWHKDTEDRDLTKTMALLDAGYIVVRVREQSRQFSLPLLPITHPNLYQIPHTLTRTESQDFSAVVEIIVSLS